MASVHLEGGIRAVQHHTSRGFDILRFAPIVMSHHEGNNSKDRDAWLTALTGSMKAGGNEE